jgi:hypothetical protein
MKMPAGYDAWKLRSDRDDDWMNEQASLESEPEPQDMVYSRRLLQLEGRPMDIADLADELEALVQEALAAGIEPTAIRETLAAKLTELHAEAGNEDTGEEDREDSDREEPEEPA